MSAILRTRPVVIAASARKSAKQADDTSPDLLPFPVATARAYAHLDVYVPRSDCDQTLVIDLYRPQAVMVAAREDQTIVTASDGTRFLVSLRPHVESATFAPRGS